MAKQDAVIPYTPVIMGEYRWNEDLGDEGGWECKLLHPILLCGEDDQGDALLIKRGWVIDLRVPLGVPRVITAYVASVWPNEWQGKLKPDPIYRATYGVDEEVLPF